MLLSFGFGFEKFDKQFESLEILCFLCHNLSSLTTLWLGCQWVVSCLDRLPVFSQTRTGRNDTYDDYIIISLIRYTHNPRLYVVNLSGCILHFKRFVSAQVQPGSTETVQLADSCVAKLNQITANQPGTFLPAQKPSQGNTKQSHLCFNSRLILTGVS